MKVAIVHDWCVAYGGAERILEHIIDCFPAADIYSVIDFLPSEQRDFLRGKTPRTSFLQKFPFISKLYRKLTFLVPLAIKQFDFADYDLVISNSHCVAKGVLTGPTQIHVCYCHSPMTCAWDHYHEYQTELKPTRSPKSWFPPWKLHRVRNQDLQTSNSVDQFIVNSGFARDRIRKFYHRESSLVFPPVDTSFFKLDLNKQDYYVAVGRFVPSNRLDLAIEAFNAMPDKRLVIVGDGPELARLKPNAASNIEFAGLLSAKAVRSYLARAQALIFPSDEEFGKLPIEAQACGTPVIAFSSNGALESIVGFGTAEARYKAPTGMFFHEQNASSLRACVENFEATLDQFSPTAISKHAQRFEIKSFKEALCEEVVTAMMKRSNGGDVGDLEYPVS